MENGLGSYWDDIADHAFAHRIYNHHLDLRAESGGAVEPEYNPRGGILLRASISWIMVSAVGYSAWYCSGITVWATILGLTSRMHRSRVRERLKFKGGAMDEMDAQAHANPLCEPRPSGTSSCPAVIQHFPTRLHGCLPQISRRLEYLIVLQIKVATLNGGKG